VTEPAKLLGPPTVVLVQRTSDNPVDAPELLEKFGICFSYLFPKSVSLVTQTLQNIGDTEMRKRLHNLHLFESKIKLVITDQHKNMSAGYLLLQYQGR
jgi:hypothetical protein